MRRAKANERFKSLLLAPLLLCPLACSKAPKAAPLVHVRPEVKAVTVQKRTITRESGQPGFIESYEQTSIYPKISGFVDDWHVDIGDRVTKGMPLAHLDRPDLTAELEEKQAQVALDVVRIKVAEEMVSVAEQNWKTAKSQVDEARANVGKYKAEVAYWTADYKRVHELYLQKAVEQPVDETSLKHMQSTTASLHAAEASVSVAEANALARQADFKKAQTDVDAARGRAKVAQASAKRLAALVGYTTVHAPYDGVVVIRNVNTGDFAMPASGDQSTALDFPGVSRTASHPLYVVARTDKMRIFLDVPEMDANGIRDGTTARITIQSVDNTEVSGKVIRTSWALSERSRTLRAEVDVPNPGGLIKPNMYAFGTLDVTRPNVWAIPLEAVFQAGNENCCYLLKDGKSVRLPVQVGIDDGTWIEVTRKRVGKEWRLIDGSEQVLLGDLTKLSNDEPVRTREPDTGKSK